MKLNRHLKIFSLFRHEALTQAHNFRFQVPLEAVSQGLE